MQRFMIMLAALAAVVFANAPQAFAGQAAAGAAAAKPPTVITKPQIDQGMKEAPPLVTASGAPCTLTSAAYVGAGVQKVDGKDFTAKFYELACSEGMGYILVTKPAPDKPQLFDCVAAPLVATKCLLPANANPASGLQKVTTAGGAACTVNNARLIGMNNTQGLNIYEVGCSEGTGYILNAPQPGSAAKISEMNCLKAELAKVECEFTPKAQRISHAAKIAAPAPFAKDCTINQARWVAGDPTKGTEYYEYGCDGGKPGFMVEASATEQFVRALNCAQAEGIAGGCTFTNVNTALTAENATYTKLATAAGMTCSVSQYRFLAVDPTTKAEMVELSCANRPASVIAYFPTDSGSKAKFYDCVRATTRGLNCKLSALDAAYPGLTQALASQGKTTCTVSGARSIGTAESSEFIETACSDKLPGWVIEYETSSDKVKSVIACTAAKGIGGGCTLPTNVVASAPAAAAGTRR